MQTLFSLTEGLYPLSENQKSVQITGISADSRAIEPGFLFVALKGTARDGGAFISDAVAHGAVAVLIDCDQFINEDCNDIIILRDENPRRRFAQFAACFYKKQPEVIAAITGTSGKTSVAGILRQIYSMAGEKAASIGTIGVVCDHETHYGNLTTPDPVTLHQHLQMLADKGISHLAMEASSHGLDQARVDGVRLSVVGFTNLGRDHMDYHDSIEAYFMAKMRLFREILPLNGTAVIDVDSEWGQRAVDICRERGVRVLTTGWHGRDVRIEHVERCGFGQSIRISGGEHEENVILPLLGSFQVSNASLAVGLAIASGLPRHVVVELLSHVKGTMGRLEVIGQTGEGALILVDYAHKPDALDHALAAMRPYTDGRLFVVFGAGGDRDRGKRILMGDIARKRADIVIVTDDNPRSEDPAVIRHSILEAVPDGIEIGDRAKAIQYAIGELRTGDILVVAGKGHESGQIVGDTVIPFSDHDVIRAVLERGKV